MRKNIILTLTLSALALVSCYDDYTGDYSLVAAGFANQTDVRSVVVGEGMSFSTGVALGGTVDNDEDRYISIATDFSLANAEVLAEMKNHTFQYVADLMSGVSSLSVLPASVYELETEGRRAGQVLIPKGSHLGKITVKLDSAAFLADAGRVYPKEVLPLRLTDGNGTDLIAGRETTVIGVRYENMLFGNWYHGGYAEKTDAMGSAIGTPDTYYTSVPQADNLVWTLTTTGPFELTANAVGQEFSGSAAQMKLTLNGDDTITISSVPGATYTVEPDGESRFVRTRLLQDRKIILNYKYSSGATTYHAHDTLSFRNRIRDGVNEVRDENSAHYE
ncbi:MAG: DUF1735 domain-containing protein [Bacteroidales bacterium]|nr:DUF1735 domain-containing protein [Bacteroidales bacterium]